MIVSALLLVPLAAAFADDEDAPKERFAPPVQLTAGGERHTGILYPSPTLYDTDDDGHPELLIGEIFGTITVSHKDADAASTDWLAAEPMEAEGKPIKLNNW
jgi:hypothetical protein